MGPRVIWSSGNLRTGANPVCGACPGRSAKFRPTSRSSCPRGSGLRLDANSPGERLPSTIRCGWEAQLVIVEGRRRLLRLGRRSEGRFKRLTATRTRGGWRLELATINDAPFDDADRVRVGDLASEHVSGRLARAGPALPRLDAGELPPDAVDGSARPGSSDIRGCVIMGHDLPMLEALARRLDPQQTLLYLPDWRTGRLRPQLPRLRRAAAELAPFVDRAHALGFRVMLHVNYFGVDPLNPLYAQFEPFQVRDPWGNHEKQWWLWTAADPPIKFAYINPACSGVARAVRRRRWWNSAADSAIDALHLDQTLCIYNDHNGRIDGLTMLEGNVALHRELRAALPEVALSGEGLNEVTCRYEAFAQRHVWGMDHADGTWDAAWLRCAASDQLLPVAAVHDDLRLPRHRLARTGPVLRGLERGLRALGRDSHAEAVAGGVRGQTVVFFASSWTRPRIGSVASSRPTSTVNGQAIAFPFRAADGGAAVR